MKSIFFSILILILLILASCDEKDNITNPNVSRQDHINKFSNGIKISLTNYDSILVENDSGSIIDFDEVSAIEIGDKITGSYIPGNRVIPVHNDTLGLQFSLPLKVTEDFIRAYHFTVRFILEDSSSVDVDTLALMYKFPYRSAEIFLKYIDATGTSIWDFNVVDNNFYYIDYYDGLYKYNLNTRNKDHLTDIKGFVYLAGNDEYQFIVYKNYMIYRYNIKSDSVDKTLDIFPSSNRNIKGIEFYNNKLYVLIRNISSSGKDYFNVYNLEGDLVETIQFDEKIWTFNGCAAYDSVFYFCDISIYNLKILKLDLRTKSLSEGKSLPAVYPSGIKFDNENLYFLDGRRQFIGSIPVSDIR